MESRGFSSLTQLVSSRNCPGFSFTLSPLTHLTVAPATPSTASTFTTVAVSPTTQNSLPFLRPSPLPALISRASPPGRVRSDTTVLLVMVPGASPSRFSFSLLSVQTICGSCATPLLFRILRTAANRLPVETEAVDCPIAFIMASEKAPCGTPSSSTASAASS